MSAPKQLLIIDDDEAIRETLREVLQDEGYGVTEAGEGLEALHKLLAGAAPDLIVVDLMMPRMNGMEFLRELKKDPALEKIPTVVITAAGQRLAPAFRAREILHKPFSVDQLLEIVARLCP